MNPTQLSELRSVIVKANPGLMDLTYGCLIEVSWVDGYETEIIEWCDRTGMHENGDNTIIEDHIVGNIVKIIGHPIHLHHVLVALNQANDETTWYAINTEGQFIVQQKEAVLVYSFGTGIGWNLTKDFEGQEENTHQFLYDILVTKNV